MSIDSDHYSFLLKRGNLSLLTQLRFINNLDFHKHGVPTKRENEHKHYPA
jgi:hypothetical protein